LLTLNGSAGWFAVLGWQTAFAASAFLTGSMIQGAAILGNNTYNALPWQATLICWCSLSLALGINLVGGKLLPRAETALLAVHIAGFFAILIPLVCMAKHNTTEQVFLTFQNGGGFKTRGLSWFVGMTTCAFAFGGADGAVHVSSYHLKLPPAGLKNPFITNLPNRWQKRLQMRPRSSHRHSC
jgi:amino acid transporter